MATRSNKRQKTEGGEEQALQELVAVQERINDMDKELAEKMLELTREYTAKKAPLYAERQSVAEAIPNFWSKVVRVCATEQRILRSIFDFALGLVVLLPLTWCVATFAVALMAADRGYPL